MKQTTFASVAWDRKGKITRRERFLAEMDAVIPWARLLALIEPHYPRAGKGTQPKPMEEMLRIYFMQQWFNLSDPQAENSLYDIESMRRFAGIEHGHDIPDESTILRFRHLLEQHQLTERIFAEIRHSLTTTPANVHDSTHISKLLHGEEREVFGDQTYWNESHRQSAQAAGVRYRTNRRPTRRPLNGYQRFINRRRSAARARPNSTRQGFTGHEVSPRKVKMAMAVHGTKSRHYHWSRMLRRHWLQTAKRCGVAARAEAEIDALIARTPKAVDEVAGRLPAGFPEAISRPVLQGLLESAKNLAAQ